MWHWIIEGFLATCLFLFMIDKLTFLWVRRCYDLVYSLMFRTGGGHLIFIDVDNFGDFNNQYGHRTGDRILREIGCILQKASWFRAFRYGGDEFAILLPWSRKKEVIELAEKIRSRIENAKIEGLDVTVCCAVVRREEDASKFLREAKRNGRNQVVVIN